MFHQLQNIILIIKIYFFHIKTSLRKKIAINSLLFLPFILAVSSILVLYFTKICTNDITELLFYMIHSIHFNTFLFVLYFMISITSILIMFKNKRINHILKNKEETFNNLLKYTAKIEKMHSEISSFKHDHMNIMLTLTNYIDTNNMTDLRKHFYAQIVPLSQTLHTKDSHLKQLMNLYILDIKSLICMKLIYALEKDINLLIEINDPIHTIHINHLDCSRVIGIFLDNAIEAALETDHPTISFYMIKQNDTVIIGIENTYTNKGISYKNIHLSDVTSKGMNRGIGLHNVSKILSHYTNIIHQTKTGERFSQVLIIY